MEKKQLYKQLSIMFDLDLKKVKSNLSLNSIRNWDSLKQMELIFFIEKKINKKFKSIDILINNAGLIYNSLIVSRSNLALKKHSYLHWKKVISSNLDSTFLTSVFTIENMIKNRSSGLIINISSIAARGNIGQSAYASAKAAIESFTITLSKELSNFGIRVAAIAPGFIETKSTKLALNEKQLLTIKNKTPAGRLGKTSELIGAIDFIIKNKFYNGKILKIDGGLTI